MIHFYDKEIKILTFKKKDKNLESNMIKFSNLYFKSLKNMVFMLKNGRKNQNGHLSMPIICVLGFRLEFM